MTNTYKYFIGTLGRVADGRHTSLVNKSSSLYIERERVKNKQWRVREYITCRGMSCRARDGPDKVGYYKIFLLCYTIPQRIDKLGSRAKKRKKISLEN